MKKLVIILMGTVLIACEQLTINNSVNLEENKRIARHYYEVIGNTGDVSEIEMYISPNYTVVYNNKRDTVGIEGAIQHIKGVMETYPDIKLTIEKQIAEGDWVVTHLTARGTHSGIWIGMKPTGKKLQFTAINVDKIIDGKIVEHGGAANLLFPFLEAGAVQVVSE